MKISLTTLKPAGCAVLGGAMALFMGCGGASAPKASTPEAGSLAYTAPTGSGYRLVRDPASTGSHLVLDLVGPAGTRLKGVVFTLNADTTRVAFANAGGTDPYVKEGQVLTLGTGTPLVKGEIVGAALQSAVFQKGAAAPATLGNQPLLSVALNLKAGAALGAVNLSSTSAQILGASGKTQAITVAVGTLSAE